MDARKTVFSQITDSFSKYHFNKIVTKYKGDKNTRSFNCWDQFLCMTFAQLTYRDSLRDIEACLTAHPQKLYHMGIKGNPTRNNIANANKSRDWRIFFEFAQILIKEARELYSCEEPFSEELENTVYALDATTIDLCLSVFPWAKFRKTKGAVKLHTLIDIKGSIPSFIEITDGSVHDVNILDQLMLEPGSFYVMDRGYLDFARLNNINENLCYFVIRSKKNLRFKRLYSSPIDNDTGLRCDQTIVLEGYYSHKDYSEKLRRVKYYDKESNRYLVFLTNNFEISALLVAELYKNRWKIELFFKWIKQHLRIKRFYGTSANAVKTQIWIAVCSYLAIAIIKKKHSIPLSMYNILQIFSVSVFEKVPIYLLLKKQDYKTPESNESNQLTIFDYLTGH